MQINSYLNLPCFFENGSYNCPKVELYGFSTEKKLHSAIRREMKKSKNKWLIYNPVGNHKSPFGI